LRHAEPPHAMGEPGGTKANLHSLHALAFAHQPVLIGNFQAIENQLAMTAMLFRAHDGNAPLDMPAGLLAVEEKSRQATARIIRGAGEQDEDLRCSSTGDEPLMAMYDPAIAALFRPRQHHAGGIG